MATRNKAKKQVATSSSSGKSNATVARPGNAVATASGSIPATASGRTDAKQQAPTQMAGHNGYLHLLSFQKKGKATRSTDLDLIDAIQAGLPAKMVKDAVESFDLPSTTVELIIPRRTLERRLKAHQPLTIEESDKLVRLLKTIGRAVEVFGDEETALRWMKSPNRAMGGRTPFSIINTSPGVELIKDILGRIEHGVYS